MADQADGSIIIDTEINSDGFKAGSAELLAAIKALSTEVKNLGQTLKELFSKPLTPEINTGGAEDKVAALEAKVQELQTSLEELQNTNGSGTPAPETATPQVNIGGVTEKASGLQREIDAVNSSVQKLEPTFQKAMSGSESAMTSFEGKASTLESKIAELQERLDAVGQTQFPTQEYAELCAETEKAGQKLESILNKQEKMQALGVSENSAQWKNLQYDLDLTAQKYDRLEAAKAKMEASGTAFQAGVDTTQYAQMESTLSVAAARLDEMRAGTQQSESLMSHLASSARNVASFIGRAAKSAAGALVSGIKAAASGMAKMLFHSKKMNSQFGGLISGSTSVSDATLTAMQATLEGMDLGPLLGLYLQTFVVQVTMLALSAIIFVIVYGRMVEIYLMVSLAPIPFATFGNHEQSHTGQNYLRSLFALGFQGFLIMICVGIYAVLIQNLSFSDNIISSIWGVMGYTVLLAFTLFKTGSLAKSVFAAH
jgi:DNA repair exonuclease SbcCD ATPase subunit